MSAYNYLKRNPSLLIGIIMVLGVVSYSTYVQYRLKKTGLITIARVDKVESAVEGVDVYITIYFKGKEYKSVVDSWCIECKGKYFFVKIFEKTPASNPKFYDNKEVPFCIINKPLPFNGWKEIPKDTCN